MNSHSVAKQLVVFLNNKFKNYKFAVSPSTWFYNKCYIDRIGLSKVIQYKTCIMENNMLIIDGAEIPFSDPEMIDKLCEYFK